MFTKQAAMTAQITFATAQESKTATPIVRTEIQEFHFSRNIKSVSDDLLRFLTECMTPNDNRLNQFQDGSLKELLLFIKKECLTEAAKKENDFWEQCTPELKNFHKKWDQLTPDIQSGYGVSHLRLFSSFPKDINNWLRGAVDSAPGESVFESFRQSIRAFDKILASEKKS